MALTFVDIAVFCIAFLTALYYYAMRPYNHFKNTKIKHFKPSIPFLGSVDSVLLKKESILTLFKRVYRTYPNEKYIGLFEGHKPQIMIQDLELLKKIGIKDFDYFPDHRGLQLDDNSDLFMHNLLIMKGDKWREMRASLSPAFTSSKMRNMFVFIEECAREVAQYFLNDQEIKEKGVVEIDVKDIVSRYTIDVIASSAFGIQINSLKDKENEFYKLGKLSSVFTGTAIAKMLGFTLFPRFMNFLKFTITPPEVSKFFKKLVTETIDNREKNGIIRHDMINLLIQAKKGTLAHDDNVKESSEIGFATVQESTIGRKQIKRSTKYSEWTDTELAAQAFIFFLAGFETTSNIITFWFYEMVRNPDVQKQLQKEIDDFLAKSNGKITYSDIHNLKYLDMTISETLRMWPSLISIDRVCAKAYSLPPPNDESDQEYIVKKDETIIIPIYAMMFDPKYYPDPEKFDPERFSDENKSNIEPMSYLPFGIGPRNCIGSRFALMEIKLIVFHLLSKFDIVSTEKTQIPVKLSKSNFFMKPEKPIFVGLKPRNIS